MSDNQPAYVTKWLGKHVEWSESGAWYRGQVLDVVLVVEDDKRRLKLRILGANGFLYPGVDERLVNDAR